MTDQPMFCAFHPNRPTTLRCNRCGRPICTSCAILTPVGYRCKVCVREQQKVFETANWYDFLSVPAVTGVICFAGSLLTGLLGFFVIFEAFFVGTVAARAVLRVVRPRRSRYFRWAAAIGGVLGCLPAMIPAAVIFLLSRASGDAGLLGVGMTLLWPGAYLAITVSFLVANL
jgi:hypothetical protein